MNAAERALMAELLTEVRDERRRSTAFWEEFASGVINHVLWVGTVIFPADGSPVHKAFSVPAGSVEVRNLDDAEEITVVAGGPDVSAPTRGTGVYIVRPGTAPVVNLASREVTFYGSPGCRASIQILTTSAVGGSGGAGTPDVVDGGTE